MDDSQQLPNESGSPHPEAMEPETTVEATSDSVAMGVEQPVSDVSAINENENNNPESTVESIDSQVELATGPAACSPVPEVLPPPVLSDAYFEWGDFDSMDESLDDMDLAKGLQDVPRQNLKIHGNTYIVPKPKRTMTQ